ncbi:hypothetical protein PQX77_021805 [Marasmius sp. AFHP31]|nr:hypothetical protein PQX77_021805 [Marasmius sp. AFHP31]
MCSRHSFKRRDGVPVNDGSFQDSGPTVTPGGTRASSFQALSSGTSVGTSLASDADSATTTFHGFGEDISLPTPISRTALESGLNPPKFSISTERPLTFRVSTKGPPTFSISTEGPFKTTASGRVIPVSTVFSTPTTGAQETDNKSSATIGSAVGGAVGLILTVVVIVIIRRRRYRGSHRQDGGFATGRRPNLQVKALPTTTVEPEHVVEKTRELKHQNVDSPGLTVTDDSQRVGGPDSEVLAKLDMLIESVGRSSPGPAIDGQSRGTDPEVLAKLDMIMERVARLEEDRDREEEEPPPDYASNRS